MGEESKSILSENGWFGVKLATWAGTGVLLNMFALSMSRSSWRTKPLSYVGFASATTIIGYITHKVYDHRKLYLEVERDRLTKRRMMRLAAEPKHKRSTFLTRSQPKPLSTVLAVFQHQSSWLPQLRIP
ncbi:hypothetical protein BC829DRAFT_445177 [Chytridium lagenaria]|nr:hypothetical protein BC829DRAFT_445177 [Chytridium lagenaria]